MTYELKNGLALFDLYRNRARRIARNRGRKIVWPRGGAVVPSIPFKSYIERVRDGINAAAAVPDMPGPPPPPPNVDVPCVPLAFCRHGVKAIRTAYVAYRKDEKDTRTVKDIFRTADAANRRSEYSISEQQEIAEWNESQARLQNLRDLIGLRDVVQPGIMSARGDRGQARPDGKRKAVERARDDMRAMDCWKKRHPGETRWATCEHRECKEWNDDQRCLDRQRAGTCATLEGRGDRPDASRHACARRASRDNRRANQSEGCKMMQIIKAIIMRHILKLIKQRTALLMDTQKYPTGSLAFERMTVAYAMIGLKIAFWRAIL